MKDPSRTNKELLEEISVLKQKIKELEHSESEIKQAEEEPRASMRQQPDIIDFLPDATLAIDKEGRVIIWNKAIEKMTGIPAAEMIGKCDYAYTIPFYGEARPQLMDLVFADSEEIAARYPNITREGYTLVAEAFCNALYSNKGAWVFCKASPLHDQSGKIIGAIESIRDITAQKQAEEELKNQTEFVATLLDTIPTPIFYKDIVGKYLGCNHAFEKFIGRSKDDIIGKGVYDLSSAEIAKKHDEKDQELFKQGGLQTYEWKAKPADGIERDVIFNKSTFSDSSGNITGLVGVIHDITERKRAEEALQESEAKYRLLVDNSYDLIWTLNAEGVFTYVSPSWLRMLGYDASYMIGKAFHPFVHPDEVAICEDYLHKVIHAREQMQGPEYRVKHVDGTWRWHAASGTPVFGSDGSFISLIGISRDITDRKQDEEALKESEQRLHIIIAGSPIPAFVIGNDHRVIHWNKALEEMSSIKSEEVAGTCAHWRAFYNVERPCMADLLVDEAVELVPQWYSGKYIKSPLIESAYEATDFFPALGENGKWLRFTAGVIRDSKGIVVAAIETLEDITVRKLAEEKYRNIFENAVMGIFQSTPEGRIINANPAFARLLGYESPEEVVNTVTDMARQMYVNPERCSELLNLMNEQGTIQGHEIQFFRKDRSIVWTNMSGRAVRDNSKTLLYYEGTIQDITDRKLLESHLSQAQKMEAIGTLAGGIAHDFNNILSAILGYTEMALGAMDKNSPLRHYLDQVYKAGERARDLVKQILAFSRQSDQKPRPLRVSPIIKEVMKLLRASLPTTIKIRQDIQSDLDTVLADPTQIHQILMNLCTNATHAMHERKGELKVSLGPVEIKDSDALSIQHGVTPGRYLKLTVSDTGAGIAPEIMNRVFDPFFTTKKPGEGTGLGLSVAYGIVKSYHGAITVESEVGKGTEFRVHLPLLVDTEEEQEEKVAAHIVGGEECILFVDDEEALVNLGKNMLTGLGYQVVGRTSSLEALELFRSRPDRFDLVITDMTMPNMTGIELAKEIMHIRPGIPVILCTGFSEAITPEKAKALGLREFIMKPIIKNQIASAIRQVLDKKE